MSTVNPKYLDIERNGVTYHIPVGVDPTTIIDDTTGSGDTDKVWSADKLVTELGGKVNTETGKGLSTNDFTTAEKNKLGALESATYDEYSVTIETTDWTQGVSGYTYTYSNQNITTNSNVDVVLQEGARDSYLDDLSYEKGTGSITFTTSSLPVAAVPLTIKVTGIVSTSTVANASAELSALESGMAIVVNGDTAPKNITKGQYLFVKNHSTLATGGYHATAAISSGASVTSNNTSPDADGLVNALMNQIKSETYPVTFVAANASGSSGTVNIVEKFGKVCHVFFDFTPTSKNTAWQTFAYADVPCDSTYERNTGAGVSRTNPVSTMQLTEYIRPIRSNDGKLRFVASMDFLNGVRYRADCTFILP